MVKEKQPGPVPGLLEELRELLERELAGEDGLTVTTQYPYQQRRLPPDRPVIWLGIEKIKAAGSCFSPWMGEEENGSASTALLGREVELTVRVEILHRQEGSVCHRLFGELCQALLLAQGRPQVQELRCGEAAFQGEAGAFRLICQAQLRAVLRQSQEERTLTNIIIKKEEKSP